MSQYLCLYFQPYLLVPTQFDERNIAHAVAVQVENNKQNLDTCHTTCDTNVA